MKYRKGDILLNFKDRRIFEVRRASVFWREVLATPDEAETFKKYFSVKKIYSVSFREFKNVLPSFNAKQKKGRLYGQIEIDEEMFLMLRAIQTREPFNSYCKNSADVLHVLLSNYLTINKTNDNEKERRKIQEEINRMRENLLRIEINIKNI